MHQDTPESAESAFYVAFEARDLEAMMAVWAADAAIACIHPLAAPLTGRAAVASGWRSIFNAAGQFSMRVERVHEIRMADLVIHVVHEFLSIGQEIEPRPPIQATNVYRREADGWRMLLHHAAPLQVGRTSTARAATQALH